MSRGRTKRRGSDPNEWVSAELLGTEMSEEELDRKAEKLRKSLGIRLSYHTHRSDRSEKGFLDRVYVGRYGVLWRELKTEIGEVTPEQQEWLDGLRNAGQDADVWRPADLFSGRIARELASIATRNPFY